MGVSDVDAVVAFAQAMRDTQATEDEAQLFCSCAAQVFQESRENPGKDVDELLGDFRSLLGERTPATS